jgi:large subunit ribosomal protein L25
MAKETKTYELAAEPREIIGKAARKVRREGLVPGVVYGHRVDPESVQVRRKEFEHVYLRAGSTTLVDLTVGKGSQPRKVFIHEVQRNPVNHDPIHVDFMVVNLHEEMTVSVPIMLVGESPMVEKGEGLLLHQTEHLLVKALPMNIPPIIEVDISILDEMDKAIHVSDIELPENVTLLTPEDELVAKITELPIIPVEEEAEEAAEAPEAEAELQRAGEAEEEES